MTATPASAPRTSAVDVAAALALLLVWAATWWRHHYIWQDAPEYQYGWLVPLLVIFFLVERWRCRPAVSADRTSAGWWIAVGFGAAIFAFARLFLEPFAHWPGMMWVLAGGSLALTWGIVGRLGGRTWVWHFFFPFAFALVALPWPEFLRQPLISAVSPLLSTVAAGWVNEFVGPAVVRGNVIELRSGMVGVEDACSGLRSLQAVLMIALFFGEYGAFSLRRRFALIGLAGLLALAANVGRTTFLTWQAAIGGPAMVEHWHDAAGYATWGVTCVGLAVVTWRWSRPGRARPRNRGPVDDALRRLPVGFAASVALSVITAELGTAWWYTRHTEVTDQLRPWSVVFPRDDEAYRPLPLSGAAQAMLRCDRSDGGLWSGPGGATRGGYFLQWESGQFGRYAVMHHNPRLCLPIAGARLVAELAPLRVQFQGVEIPFQVTRFEDHTGEFLVYFSAVEPGHAAARPVPLAGWWNWFEFRCRDVRDGRRHGAMQSLTLAVWHLPAHADPRALLETELRRIVRVERPAFVAR